MRERYVYSYVIRVQRTSVARVAVFPAQLGYFENTVVGKITEPWVAFFFGYFNNVPQPPKVYIYTCDRKRKLSQTLDGGLK